MPCQMSTSEQADDHAVAKEIERERRARGPAMPTQAVHREMRVGALHVRGAEEDQPREDQDRELLGPDDRRAEYDSASTPAPA